MYRLIYIFITSILCIQNHWTCIPEVVGLSPTWVRFFPVSCKRVCNLALQLSYYTLFLYAFKIIAPKYLFPCSRIVIHIFSLSALFRPSSSLLATCVTCTHCFFRYFLPQQAMLTFEDDQLDRALENLKRAQRIIFVEDSKKVKVELDEALMRQILYADCELYMALLTFLKQGNSHHGVGFNPFTLRSSKHTFSQPFKEKCIGEVVRVGGQYNHLLSE